MNRRGFLASLLAALGISKFPRPHDPRMHDIIFGPCVLDEVGLSPLPPIFAPLPYVKACEDASAKLDLVLNTYAPNRGKSVEG